MEHGEAQVSQSWCWRHPPLPGRRVVQVWICSLSRRALPRWRPSLAASSDSDLVSSPAGGGISLMPGLFFDA